MGRAINGAQVENVHIIDSWAVIHQATGMIGVQLDVQAPVALERLQAYAVDRGRAVESVAADVVARRLRFGD